MSKRKKNSGMTIKVRRRTFNVSIRDNIDVDGNIYHTYRTFMTRSLLNGNKERLEITATTIDKLREKLSEIQMPYRMLMNTVMSGLVIVTLDGLTRLRLNGRIVRKLHIIQRENVFLGILEILRCQNSMKML